MLALVIQRDSTPPPKPLPHWPRRAQSNLIGLPSQAGSVLVLHSATMPQVRTPIGVHFVGHTGTATQYNQRASEQVVEVGDSRRLHHRILKNRPLDGFFSSVSAGLRRKFVEHARRRRSAP